MLKWDWGPQLPDMGIWRDVNLYGYSQGKIEDIYIEQKHEDDSVELSALVEAKLSGKEMTLSVGLYDKDGEFVESDGIDLEILGDEVEGIQSVNESFEFEILVKNPHLWWPNGYGESYLYTLKVELICDEVVVDTLTKKIGLRTVTVLREPDQYGETFDITVNGIRIFAMGANYIPEDSFIARPSYETTKRLIKDCAKANYNCLRAWGGGVYPSDDFYDLCDEYGLLVWQDFTFACGVYRLTDKFEANIRAEFIDNIKRIRHHACLALWCGNNEMEVAFVEWGLPRDERLKMDYLMMYEKLIPNILADYDPNTFYWPASPSSGGGFAEPNDDAKGDVHYWAVFHGGEHYKKYRDHYFRFASEYGMQAFPDIKTVKSYAPKDQRNIFSPIMENHNKCIEPFNGNVKVLLNMVCEYMAPKETEDIVYLSQVFQGEAIKCAVEHLRRNRGRCMGSTYWQVNDNYPVASWSSIDYYGRWKALHYYARRFYAPLLLSAYEEGTRGHLHITNDQMTTFKGKATWQLRHVTKGILESGEIPVEIERLSAMHLKDVSIDSYVEDYGEERNLFLSFQLMDDTGAEISSDTLLFTFGKHFNFNKARVEHAINEKDGKYTITISSDVYARAVGIQFETVDVVLSNNYFDVLPGQSVTVEIEEVISSQPITIDELKKQIYTKAVNSIAYE